jgi:arginine repressor
LPREWGGVQRKIISEKTYKSQFEIVRALKHSKPEIIRALKLSNRVIYF